jgi:lysylphosphatidylglycerol synthetase-like protein (DUF2156 family)
MKHRLLWQFLATLIVVALVMKFIWWLIAGAAIILFGVVSVKAWEHHTASLDAEAKRLDAIRARADEQHTWVIQGDPRGTYGNYPVH